MGHNVKVWNIGLTWIFCKFRPTVQIAENTEQLLKVVIFHKDYNSSNYETMKN